jgi:Flp pilus assembly protein protease CpaA
MILLVICVCDFVFFRIENEYVLALMALYAISWMSGISGSNFYNGLIIAIATFAGTLVLNHFNLIGGGDVKLLFPVILLSENNLSEFWIGISVGGMILAIIYLIFGRQIFFLRRSAVGFLYSLSRGRNKTQFLNFVLPSLSRIDKKVVALRRYTVNAVRQEIPYGIAIACGGFYVIFENLLARW